MNIPPPMIAGLYVVEFANLDKSVRFEQRNTLNVGGEWLERVPNLAICRHLDRKEFMVQHCSEEWEPLGIASGFKSVTEAKNSIERSYIGLSGKWKITSNNFEEEKSKYNSLLKEGGCSFCGRTILEISAMAGDEVRICNYCIDEFYEVIHENDKKT